MSLVENTIPSPLGAAGPAGSVGVPARDCLERAVRYLLAVQDPGGWWKGELETNVTMDAEDVLLRHVLGITDPEGLAASARWIRSRQRDDGSWATFYGGPGDLSTTVEAYVALRLAGDQPEDDHLRRARDFVLGAGGLGQSRVFTRLWLALVGQWPWTSLPALPPELVWLPRWFPLNVYDWACWARQTIVPLTVVSALRPVRPLGFDVDELRRPDAGPPARQPWYRVDGLFDRADRLLWRYHRRPPGRLRRAAIRRAVAWVVERQEADGSWGGIQPPWVYSIIALYVAGYALDHPVLRAAVDGLERFCIVEDTIGEDTIGEDTIGETPPDGPVRRLEACQSPVWDTALAVVALREAGRSVGDDAVRRAVRWLLGEEVRRRGDWAVRRPDVDPGGWAFEFENDFYPDVDDTAEVILALHGTEGAEAAVHRGVEWVLAMQCRDGGWAAFDVDNTSSLVARLPFCDFGAVTDPPSADVTAHVVEMLARTTPSGHPRYEPALRRGVAWLLDHQEDDGSWFGRWGVNHVYGVGAVVPALVEAGIAPDHPAVRRAVAWTLDHQNDDGGWGEDLRSYTDPAWRGRGASTASQTAWALLALLAAGERGAAAQAGVDWLVRRQRPDGSWDEPQLTGTGFPGDFYLGYHLYRQVFPVTALARHLRTFRRPGAGP
jgi:squalene-hopene/tetraprenyl-beta-curcumene cyclase